MTRWEATTHKAGAVALRDPNTGSQPLSRRSMTGWSAVTLIGAAFVITMLPTALYPLYEKVFGSVSWSPRWSSPPTRQES
jgi:hypothetical protein